MLHSNLGQTDFIGTHESVYRDSPIGNLEGFIGQDILPLQQGFYGDICACISVGVRQDSALLAPEQGIVAAVVSLPHSTAVVTELGGMPRIDDVQRNLLICASCDKVVLESEERNSHNFSVELPSLGTESVKVLYGNVGIESKCKVSNVPDDFADSVLHEVVLVTFSLFECLASVGTSPVEVRPKNTLPLKYLLPSHPDVLSEVILMQNLSFGRNDGNSKAFAVHINSQNIPLGGQSDLFFVQVCDNLQVGGQSIRLAIPSSCEKVMVPLPVAVLDKGNRNPVSRIESKFNEVEGLGGEGLAVAWNVELSSYAPCLSFALPNLPFNIADNLGIERSVLLCGRIDLPVEVHKLEAEVPLLEKPVELRKGLVAEFPQCLPLGSGGIVNLQEDSTFHALTKGIMPSTFIRIALEFLPRMNSWVSFSVNL